MLGFQKYALCAAVVSPTAKMHKKSRRKTPPGHVPDRCGPGFYFSFSILKIIFRMQDSSRGLLNTITFIWHQPFPCAVLRQSRNRTPLALFYLMENRLFV